MADPVRPEDLEQQARKLYVTKGMVKDYGYSDGCQACNAHRYNRKVAVPHSAVGPESQGRYRKQRAGKERYRK